MRRRGEEREENRVGVDKMALTEAVDRSAGERCCIEEFVVHILQETNYKGSIQHAMHIR